MFLSNFEGTDHGSVKRKQLFHEMFVLREAGRNDSHGEEFLDLVAEQAANIGMFLNKITSVIDFVKSAEELLTANVPVPVNTDIKNDSSESTTANYKFLDDPLDLQILNRAASGPRNAIPAFDKALAKVQQFFYDKSFRKYVHREGDVV
jgi:hypothetical protein